MSEKYVTPPVISFEAIFEQSNPFSPIIFILSPGSDPASDLMKLAERSGFGGNKLKFLAMGQGQEKVTPLICLHFFCFVFFYFLIIKMHTSRDEKDKECIFSSLPDSPPVAPYVACHSG